MIRATPARTEVPPSVPLNQLLGGKPKPKAAPRPRVAGSYQDAKRAQGKR